jgi:predicted nucleic acid-binding protein
MRSTVVDAHRAPRLFVDTWGWLVLANDQDPAFEHVATARAAASGRQGAWVTTTDYVVDETITRLFTSAPFAAARRFTEGLFEASRQGLLDIEHVTPGRFRDAWRLRVPFHDRPRISFTDLTSFVVMRELGLRRVITANAHFLQARMGFVRIP